MSKRYADFVKKNRVDFIFRPHARVVSLLIITGIYLISIIILDYFNCLSALYHIPLTLLFVCLVVVRIKQNSNILHYTEFQNTLFANSLKKDTQFFLIIDKNGSIIYDDERNRVRCVTFSQFVDQIGLDDEKRELLFDSFHKRSYCRVELILEEFLIDAPILQLELSSLSRPDGYFILKASRLIKESVYSKLMDDHVVGSYILNSDGLLLSANKSFLDLIEVESFDQEILYLPELVHPISDMKLNTVFGNMINTYVTAKVLYDRKGNKFIYGLVTPKNFERSEFLEAPIAIAQFNKYGEILKHNYAFSQLVGSGCKSITDIAKDNIDFHLYFREQSKNKISSNMHLKNGKVINFFLKKSADSIIVFFFDITQYKKIEEQLLHSQKIHSIGELAGGIAHDFNNILAAIVGFCDLILMRFDSQDKTFVDIMQIKQNTERAAHLVSKLLAFSSRQTLQLEVLEISEVLDGVLPLINRLIGSNVNLKINYDNNIGHIKADKRQLEQVVMNLAINARDAFQKDTGNLTIDVREEVVVGDIENMITVNPEYRIVPGEYVVLKFADDGCGIPEDIISKIFNPFFSTKNEGDGTGLGLSTVYGIIKQVGGYVYIKSELGHGTQINIYLPKVYEKVSTKNSIINTFRALDDNVISTKNILLVEDENSVRDFITRALTEEGHNVYDYPSPVEALKGIDDKVIDIVLTDIIMPEVSGIDMVNQIRKRIPDVQIIFISGYSKKKLENVDFKYFFLQKPFSLDKIMSKIKEASYK